MKFLKKCLFLFLGFLLIFLPAPFIAILYLISYFFIPNLDITMIGGTFCAIWLVSIYVFKKPLSKLYGHITDILAILLLDNRENEGEVSSVTTAKNNKKENCSEVQRHSSERPIVYRGIYGEYVQHPIELPKLRNGKEDAAISQNDYTEKKEYAQKRVDAFYAEIFDGQTDPFTQSPILSESDYRKYQLALHQRTGQSFQDSSFDELAQEAKFEQARVNAMSKEAYAQYRVDKVCAKLFSGQLSPYTNQPILTEADFREYQAQHESEIIS